MKQAELKRRKCITLLGKWRNRHFLYKSYLQEKQMRTDVSQQEMEGGVSGIPLGMIFSVHLLTYSSWSEFASKVNYAVSQGTGMGGRKMVQVNWSKRKGYFRVHLPWGEWQCSRKESLLFKSGMYLEPRLHADQLCCIFKKQWYYSHSYDQKYFLIIPLSTKCLKDMKIIIASIFRMLNV